jgi:hypothetical protein
VIGSLIEAAASDIRSRLEMKNFMQTRTVAILTVTLAIAVFLSAGPLAAQQLETSQSHQAANEVYAPSVTAAVYLVNFLLLYMANPDIAAYMPAYRAPIPQPVVDCLEQNPMGLSLGRLQAILPRAGFRQQGMLLAGRVSGERKMGAPGAAQSQTP